MLGEMTSFQLTEWAAYELVSGPLDRRYDQEVLASIHEQLQSIRHVLGAAHFTNEKQPDNPVPEPVKFPRPEEMLKRVEDEEAE